MTLKVKINGKTYEAEKGEYILNVCRHNHILVPTLCHHDGISGLGACRLCVVEVDEGSGNKVVVSCVYPLNRDCVVLTESEKIKGIRRTLLSMLKTRAPAGDRLASLCQMYGVSDNKRFTPPKPKKGSPRITKRAEKRLASSCVLCGLCVHACNSIGTGAISTVGRGVIKQVGTPFNKPPADCVGCKSCAVVCPTKAIEYRDGKTFRSIWGKKFKLLCCESCGQTFATEEEYALARKKAVQEKIAGGKASPPDPEPVICDACRKKKSSDVFAAAFGGRV